MKVPTSCKRVLAAAALAAIAMTQRAGAVPVNGLYLEDPRCDNVPQQSLIDELGAASSFPINESIVVQTSPASFTVCAPNDGIQNDWIVQMTNVSGVAWKNLFFVANVGMSVGNADGSVVDVINAPGVATDAFRIDGTVTVALNNNLLGESGVVDEIFAPGETWRFNVSNFTHPSGASLPPIFSTPGLFAGSAPVVIPPIDTASILATPVPEPTVVSLVAFGAAALLMRRPRRS